MAIAPRLLTALAAGWIAVASANAADAASIVKVSLWDKGEMSMVMPDGMTPMGMAMQGDMSMATMGITATPGEIAAGEVTFEATNDSKSIIHEMILAPVAADGGALPYDTESMLVDEEVAKALGEVSELDPGASGALTVTLEPGAYILFCNIPGHYVMGMWTTVTVK